MPGDLAPGDHDDDLPPAGGSAASANAANASTGVLDALLTVQDLDTAISQLEHRRAALPERRELASAEASLAASATRVRDIGARRDELLERQVELESEIAALTARRELLEQRMYAARGAPARDLQAMDDEISHLRARREELEDAELDVMVALEPLDAELGTIAEGTVALRSQVDDLRRAIAEAESVIDAELEERRDERARAVTPVPADLRARYEALRARLGGTGAARLVGNRCGGCHLELPSMEVERIRHLPPGSVVTCEQCGRILVPAKGQ